MKFLILLLIVGVIVEPKHVFGSKIDFSSNKEIMGDEESEVVRTILYEADSLHGMLPVNNFTYYALAVTSNLTVHQSMRTYHYYDNPEDLKLSGGPKADQELCLVQLEGLLSRLDMWTRQDGESKDLNLEQLLDTWGRRPSGIHLGHNVWSGMYNECKRLKIITTPSQQVNTRYCMASMGRQDWAQDEPYTIRVGTCLPEACDSIDHKNKYQLIQTILKSINKGRPLDELNLKYLYCLPDEQSALRAWPLRTKMFVGILAAWMLLIVYATYTDKFQALSIRRNLALLFSVKRSQVARAVDLNVTDGVKVIAALAMIVNHSLLYLGGSAINPYELTSISSRTYVFITGVMATTFSVDIFFVITGILIAYSSFKGTKPTPLATRPKLWLEMVGKRYFKIMSFYVLIVAYGKYLAKYIGSGPYWDYGTAATGIRKICEEESWLGTLLYSNAWRSPPYTCLPAAWYLACDFIFILITPIFFQLLHWRPKVGRIALLLGILASYLSGAIWFFNSKEDLRPAIYPTIQSLKFYLEIIFDFHIQPQYRIGPYLAGLLIGYQLCERDRTNNPDGWQTTNWFKVLKVSGLPLASLALILIALWAYLMEIIGLNENRSLAHFLMYTSLPFNHLAIGTIFGIVIMLASTGHTNKCLKSFLAAPLWKPFSKVMLSVMMINITVVDYVFSTITQLLYIENLTVISWCSTVIVVTYLLAAALYIFVEAPMGLLFDSLFSGSRKCNKCPPIDQNDQTSCIAKVGSESKVSRSKLESILAVQTKL